MWRNQNFKEAVRKSFFVFLFIAFLFLPVLTFNVQPRHGIEQTSNAVAMSISPFYGNDIISTRGHYDYLGTGDLNPEFNTTDYVYLKNGKENTSDATPNKITCPPENEIAIYIHGAWTDEMSASEQLNRTAMALVINNNSVPLIGFSWDSNTPLNKEGWKTAKIIADNNGPKLARFIIDLKNKCQDTNIRLIAHSLGAAVVNSTLISLHNDLNTTTNNGFNITSVHLLGAAINRDEIASNSTFGNAIENIVDNFYNLRNPEDNMLEYVYRFVEDQDALGLLGIQHSVPMPRDYIEHQVDSEIPAIQDADGNNKLDCFDFFVLLPGDNHCGYIGFRGLPPFENILLDDGSIDIIVQDWLE